MSRNKYFYFTGITVQKINKLTERKFKLFKKE